MASKSSSRAAARKVKDRWRAKNWYRVMAPDMFEAVQIGETPADDPNKVIGRMMDVTLQQLTGDFSKMHIKLNFRIDSIKGSDAFSNFIGHNLTSDYIRRLTRRKRSKTDGVFDVLTKDGFTLRIKPMAVTEKRIQTSQQHAIRIIMKNVIEKQAKDKLVSELIREMLSGEISSLIFKQCKPIYPIKRVEIRRSEIRGVPERGPEMMVAAEETTIAPASASEETKGEEAVLEPEIKEDAGETKPSTTKTKKSATKIKKSTTKPKKSATNSKSVTEKKPE